MTKIREEHEPQEQRHWSIVQLQNTWIAVGIILLGLGITAASLSQKNWIAVGVLLLIGILICAFSRQIASAMFRMESNRMQNITNATSRRIAMPNSLKNLATVAAWVLFVLACICLVGGIAYIVLISFNLLYVTSPVILPLVYLGFGILCLFLAFLASWIRSKIE